MPSHGIQRFLAVWEHEAKKTVKLLESLPAAQYDFRADPHGRSLGELAWHLAEVDGYVSHGIELGKFFSEKPPGIERPRTIEALAPAYVRVHQDAVARVRKLTDADLDRKLKFIDSDLTLRDILWGTLFNHTIHHRGQLQMMCRLAGGTPPGLFGPTREEMAAMTKGR